MSCRVADSLFRPHPEQRARASREPKLAIFEERGGKLAEEGVMKLSHWTRQLPKVKGRKRNAKKTQARFEIIFAISSNNANNVTVGHLK